MSFLELDRVRILRAIPAARVHRCTVHAYRAPSAGDAATVVFAYPTTAAHDPLFMVECIGGNGVRHWLADVHASEMEGLEAIVEASPVLYAAAA